MRDVGTHNVSESSEFSDSSGHPRDQKTGSNEKPLQSLQTECLVSLFEQSENEKTAQEIFPGYKGEVTCRSEVERLNDLGLEEASNPSGDQLNVTAARLHQRKSNSEWGPVLNDQSIENHVSHGNARTPASPEKILSGEDGDAKRMLGSSEVAVNPYIWGDSVRFNKVARLRSTGVNFVSQFTSIPRESPSELHLPDDGVKKRQFYLSVHASENTGLFHDGFSITAPYWQMEDELDFPSLQSSYFPEAVNGTVGQCTPRMFHPLTCSEYMRHTTALESRKLLKFDLEALLASAWTTREPPPSRHSGCVVTPTCRHDVPNNNVSSTEEHIVSTYASDLGSDIPRQKKQQLPANVLNSAIPAVESLTAVSTGILARLPVHYVVLGLCVGRVLSILLMQICMTRETAGRGMSSSKAQFYRSKPFSKPLFLSVLSALAGSFPFAAEIIPVLAVPNGNRLRRWFIRVINIVAGPPCEALGVDLSHFIQTAPEEPRHDELLFWDLLKENAVFGLLRSPEGLLLLVPAACEAVAISLCCIGLVALPWPFWLCLNLSSTIVMTQIGGRVLNRPAQSFHRTGVFLIAVGCTLLWAVNSTFILTRLPQVVQPPSNSRFFSSWNI